MSRPIRQSLAFLSAERFVLNTAYRFVYPFLPVIARGLGVPLEQAAYLISVRHFSGLATPAVNLLIGRGELRRRLIVTGLGLFIAGSAVTVLTNVYVGALVGFALLGLSKPVFDVSTQAYISDRVPYQRRARHLATFEFTWSLSLLIGAPLAGWLISRTDWATPFWVFGLVTAAALLLVPRFIDPDDHHATTPGPQTRFESSAIALLIVIGLFSLASEIIFVVFGAWLESSFAVSMATLGGAAFLIGAAELAGEGGTFAFTDRIGPRRAVIIGLVVSIAGFASLVPTRDAMGVGLALIAVSIFGFEFTLVSAIPLATEVAPSARARYLAWMVVAIGIARGVGAAVSPLLFRSFDLTGPAIAALAADVLALGVLIVWVRDHTENGGTDTSKPQAQDDFDTRAR